MKLFVPLALFAAAVMAQKECDAEVIVQTCLESEQAKFNACKPTDFDCQCFAMQAVATCYNNCPGDNRIADAAGQVSIYCSNAEIHGTLNKPDPTATPKPTNAGGDDESTDAQATDAADSDSTPTGDAAPSESSPGSAAELAMNAGGVLLAVAGVMAVVV